MSAVRGVSSDLRDVIHTAKDRGWELCAGRTGAGNLKLERPNPGGLPSIVTISANASGYALRNAEAQLYRAERDSGWAYCGRHRVMYVATALRCPRCKQAAREFNPVRVVASELSAPPEKPAPPLLMTVTKGAFTNPERQMRDRSEEGIRVTQQPQTPSTAAQPGAKRRQPNIRKVPYDQLELLIEEGLKTGRWKARGANTAERQLFHDAGYDSASVGTYKKQWQKVGYVRGHVYDAFERLIFDNVKSRRMPNTMVRQPIPPRVKKEAAPEPSASAPLQPDANSGWGGARPRAGRPFGSKNAPPLEDKDFTLLSRLLAAHMAQHPASALEAAALLTKLGKLAGK